MSIRRISLMGLIAPAIVWASTPQVLMNRQGLAQQDLSIRGSSYTGAGISVNGLNLKVPYSAHFNSELPALDGLLSEATLQHGLGNVSGHLAGTAAYTTLPLEIMSEASAGIGTREHYMASLFGSSENLGGFLDWEKVRRIDHGENDLERFAGSAFVQFQQSDWQFDILTASQTKKFGAQGYYGIPSAVYAEERTEDDLLFFSATNGDLDGSYLRASAGYREFDDEYHIPSFGFANDVLSRFGTVTIEGRTIEVQHIALNLRGNLEHERISGDLDSHDRTRGSVLIMPEARFEHFTVKAGLNNVFQSDESAEWLPQAGIDWLASDNSTVYASYSENVQQPDYQTLYYNDGFFRIGNQQLHQQKASNAEMGIRQLLSENLDWRMAAFHRRIENASDWVKNTAADIAWTASDLGNMDVFGAEAEINWYPSESLELTAFYQWIEKDDYDFYAGLYELDYPEHLLAFSGFWQFIDGFELFGTQILRWQADNNYRTSNDFGADASVGLHWFPSFAHNARLSFRVDNLWGSNFQAIPGLKPRDLSASTGITVTW